MRSFKLAAFLLALSATALGCPRRAPEPLSHAEGSQRVCRAADSAAVVESEGARHVRRLLAALYGQFEKGSSSIIAKYGTPRRLWLQPVVHRSDRTRIDTLVTIDYPGLHVDLFRWPDGGEQPIIVWAEHSRFLPWSAVGIGSPADELETVFGQPSERTASSLRYAAGCDALTLRVRDGVLRVVHASYGLRKR